MSRRQKKLTRVKAMKDQSEKEKPKKTNVDWSDEMKADIEEMAEYMNISFQAVVKGYVRDGLAKDWQARLAKKQLKQ